MLLVRNDFLTLFMQGAPIISIVKYRSPLLFLQFFGCSLFVNYGLVFNTAPSVHTRIVCKYEDCHLCGHPCRTP